MEKNNKVKNNRIVIAFIFIVIVICITICLMFPYIFGNHYIDCPELGCTLILPESWKGKYMYDNDGEMVTVYHKKSPHDGILFYFSKTDEVMNEEQVMESAVAPERYMGSDLRGTYIITLASDSQENDSWDTEEYIKMYDEINLIEIDIYNENEESAK